ncbi:SiaB family protein kinase [uncultured Oxalicibacterium sp.]|uniref:SiaB family protein kinase n=1 Tax=uncultured Oxalicibacterium sp. TaxID=1168540 RepID=UPI0025D87D1A|nr:SiaB family protein kinase [uncultured Oxalicibacterium sp.]
MHNHSPQDLHQFCQCAEQRDVIFYYVGYFSQPIIAAMAEAVKTRVEQTGAAASVRRKLFSSFVEMAQNIVHYSADHSPQTEVRDGDMRHGSVSIALRNGHYHLHCGNPVQMHAAEELRIKLEHLRALTMDEIKQEYKEALRAETPTSSKGAGLGLLTMARDASAPLEFRLAPMDEATMMFCLKAMI